VMNSMHKATVPFSFLESKSVRELCLPANQVSMHFGAYRSRFPPNTFSAPILHYRNTFLVANSLYRSNLTFLARLLVLFSLELV
jgi:hypothetical protein